MKINVKALPEDKIMISMQEAFFLSRRSMCNESRLKQSGICGCYHCGSIFEVSEIQEWADDGGEDKTAICPKCGIDSVLDKDAVSPFTSAVLKHFSSMGDMSQW